MVERNEYKSADELRTMSNGQLADYIDSCSFDYDWTSRSIREAVARLLRTTDSSRTVTETKL